MDQDVIKNILKEYDYFFEEYNRFVIEDEKYSLDNIILKLLNRHNDKLIEISELSNTQHKFFYTNGLYVDIDKLIDLFNDYLDERFKRNYPRFVDNCLTKYKNVYINNNTFKNYLKEIEKAYPIKNIKRLYNESDRYYGYILEI